MKTDEDFVGVTRVLYYVRRRRAEGMYFLRHERKWTWTAIGKRMGISGTRVKQIVRKIDRVRVITNQEELHILPLLNSILDSPESTIVVQPTRRRD